MSPKICGNKSEQVEILHDTRKKTRGPYRKYNFFGSTAKIPARTKSRWRLTSRVQNLNKTYSPDKILHLSTNYDSIRNLKNCIDQESQIKQDSNEVLLLDEEIQNQVIKVNNDYYGFQVHRRDNALIQPKSYHYLVTALTIALPLHCGCGPTCAFCTAFALIFTSS
ncbi:uncharacterized protein LOC141535035 [Cotesia typhae]|uniref:uncharacterized protein LOC141535035 n=1 Tax=Cotesia typhae TaxID=2053667 RepID=UPI003D68B804